MVYRNRSKSFLSKHSKKSDEKVHFKSASKKKSKSKGKKRFRIYWRYISIIWILWLGLIYYHESAVVKRAMKKCQWSAWEKWPKGAESHRVGLFADPQIMDEYSYPKRPQIVNYFTRVLVDHYHKRNWKYVQYYLDPDSSFFLGDLFDGGRNWGDEQWIKEYTRFNQIFPKKPMRRTVMSLPGNHDIGFGDTVVESSLERFSAYFGETSSFLEAGNHTFVLLDTISLSDKANPNVSRIPMEFLNNFARSSHPYPRILLTHVPLWRNPTPVSYTHLDVYKRQVISRVAIMNEKCSQLFDWFLNFYLLNREAHSKEIYDKVTHVLIILTDFLVQKVVELNSEDTEEKNMIIDKQNFLNLLAKFADSTVSFLTKDHITALYPYMVSDDKSDFHYHILQVFRSTFEKLSNFKPKFLYDLETTLLSRLPKMSVREIDEAMPLIWSIATHRSDATRVAKACSSCLSHLHPYINNANKEEITIAVDGKLQRLIYLSTGFARFCFPKIPKEKIAFLQENETLYEHITKCLLVLSKDRIPHVIRRVAVKNLTKLCGNHPKPVSYTHLDVYKRQAFELPDSQRWVGLVSKRSNNSFFTF